MVSYNDLRFFEIIMDAKKNKLIELMKRNVFLKKEDIEKIIGKIDSLSVEQLDTMIDLLSQADEKQKIVFEKILKDDPNFFNNLQHESIVKAMDNLKAEEAKDRASEENELKELEAQLV